VLQAGHVDAKEAHLDQYRLPNARLFQSNGLPGISLLPRTAHRPRVALQWPDAK